MKDIQPILVPNVVRSADDFASGAADVFYFAFGAPKVREVDATVGGIRMLEVDERWKDKFGVWMVRNETEMYALITTCTHLGCTPNWLPSQNKFKCPCHGSGYYRTGVNFEGPAPRPLERVKISIDPAEFEAAAASEAVRAQEERLTALKLQMAERVMAAGVALPPPQIGQPPGW
mgnify:CR=1 FL=1